MASRYNHEYFFQHLLMNVPFTDLNDIIHPNAENIPKSLRDFASAMFTNGCCRNDATKFDMIWKSTNIRVTTSWHILAISAWWKPVTIYAVATFLFLWLILPYTHISFSQFPNVMSNLQILALKFQLLLFWLNCIWFELFIDTLINSYVLLWIKLIFFK